MRRPPSTNTANTSRRPRSSPFPAVYVEEPSVNHIAILARLKERYEVHHGVRIQDAPSSPRHPFAPFISPTASSPTSRDLMDEAASRCAWNSTRCRPRSTSWTAKYAIGNRAKRLEKGEDEASRERLARLEKNWRFERDLRPAQAQWQNKKPRSTPSAHQRQIEDQVGMKKPNRQRFEPALKSNMALPSAKKLAAPKITTHLPAGNGCSTRK